VVVVVVVAVRDTADGLRRETEGCGSSEWSFFWWRIVAVARG
jgi:hypothetical protein